MTFGNKVHYTMSSLQKKHSDVRLAIHNRMLVHQVEFGVSLVMKVNRNILARLQHHDKNISAILLKFYYKGLD